MVFKWWSPRGPDRRAPEEHIGVHKCHGRWRNYPELLCSMHSGRAEDAGQPAELLNKLEAQNTALIKTIRRLFEHYNLHVNEREDTIGVLMKCGVFQFTSVADMAKLLEQDNWPPCRLP